jgi:bifunctional DNA-binding transcriptional regulator/antitoxin component of YhaV-PrlF toxin-antitoxin module
MLVFLISIFTTSIQGQVYNTQIEAEIKMTGNSEFMDVSAYAYNKTQISQSLRYIFTVFRTDPSGNKSKNEQTNRFILQTGEKKKLANTTISNQDQSRMIVLLLIYNLEDQLLGKDRIVLNDDSEEKKIILKPKQDNDVRDEFAASDGVELRGIVLEDTKTKPGRDFYKEYYTGYTYYNINGPKIITIKEVLAIANNTKIEVLVGDEIILEFFVRPQNDYIRGMAETAVRRTIAYFKNLEKQKNIVRQY